jgi:hypothetical protein
MINFREGRRGHPWGIEQGLHSAMTSTSINIPTVPMSFLAQTATARALDSGMGRAPILSLDGMDRGFSRLKEMFR